MSTDRTQAAYDQIAQQYAIFHAAMPPQLAAAADHFVRSVGAGARLLDSGRGAGRDVSGLEGLSLTIIGLDISSGLLAQARMRASGALLRMDMRGLGLRARQFQGVWGCASLLHLPKSEALLSLR